MVYTKDQEWYTRIRNGIHILWYFDNGERHSAIVKIDFLFDPNRDVYSTKGTGHWGTEENRPWEENRPQICKKNREFWRFYTFLGIDLGF